MSVYFPGPIMGILGTQGSGKSFAALKFALQVAEQLHYDLCFNFSVNAYYLYKYSYRMGYTWCMGRLMHGHWRCKSSSELEKFMDRPLTIYILDEAGVYLNSRKFAKVSDDFISDLAQVRHDGMILWWIAQYHDMVDRILRELSAGFLHCESTLKYNKDLGNTEILWQSFSLFENKKYLMYLRDLGTRSKGIGNFFSKRKLSNFSWSGWLSENDRYLFNVYKSFGSRVGGSIELMGSDFYKRTYQKVDYESQQESNGLIQIQQQYRIVTGQSSTKQLSVISQRKKDKDQKEQNQDDQFTDKFNIF